MESRGIYLRVATFLRAQHAPIEFEYGHSGLTLNLHGNVLESELSFQARLTYVTAFAALHAHPDADFAKAADKVNDLHANAFYSIPYYAKMNEAKAGEVDADAKAMAARYKEVFKKSPPSIKPNK